MIIITIILSIILIYFIIYYLHQRNQTEKQIEQKYLERQQERLRRELEILTEKANQQKELINLDLQKQKEKLEQTIQHNAQLAREIEQRNKLLDEFCEKDEAQKKLKIEVEVNYYRQLKEQAAEAELVKAELVKRQEEVNNTLQVISSIQQEISEIEEKKVLTNNELDKLENELSEWKLKQQAINEDIRRRRELEEQSDFYRVCLTPEAIEDIALLQQVRQKLHRSDNLNKLIYDVYVSKAVLEMTKRVLAGAAPSGIYKITRLKTGEVYVGKSTDVKSRWQQHCRTVYGAGTIAHSILHTTMERDGLENFTFELVEVVPKDKLTEREKFWINFYGSKEYGLNEKLG